MVAKARCGSLYFFQPWPNRVQISLHFDLVPFIYWFLLSFFQQQFSAGFGVSTLNEGPTPLRAHATHALSRFNDLEPNIMIPLIPVLVLSFLSFASSAFVILRIIIPILPPHPLSRRVSPVRFPKWYCVP